MAEPKASAKKSNPKVAAPAKAPHTTSPTPAPLYMGIDLGTLRSSVVASNGQRHVVESYVGWPVDAIARRVVKKPFLIGREALDHRPMLDLHRPLEAGYIKEGSDSDKDVEAVQELLRHLLGLAGVEFEDPQRPAVYAVIGVPARTMVGQQQYLRNAVQGIVDQIMIVPEPFAVAYGLGALVHTMIIDSSSQIAGLTASLEQALSQLGGGQAEVVADPVFAGACGGLSLAEGAAEADWETLVMSSSPQMGSTFYKKKPFS